MSRPTALVIEADTKPGEPYGGHVVSINGVPIAHRPYDGSSAEEVEREIVEALGVWLRRMMGWPQEAPMEEDDD